MFIFVHSDHFFINVQKEFASMHYYSSIIFVHFYWNIVFKGLTSSCELITVIWKLPIENVLLQLQLVLIDCMLRFFFQVVCSCMSYAC